MSAGLDRIRRALASSRSWRSSALARGRCASAALIALFLLLVVGISHRERLNPELFAVPHLDDAALHAATVERLRLGHPYYATVGAELRDRGYPSASIPNWRTPLHYRLVSTTGIQRAGNLLALVAALAIVAGALALRSRSRKAGSVAAFLLFGTMLPVLLHRQTAAVFAENWAGVLIALSVAAYHLRWRVTGAGLGVAAVFLRELAVPYAVVCGVLALLHRRRGESAVWMTGGIAYVVYYALHMTAVTAAMQPGDYAWTHSWVRWLGWPFVLQTAWVSGWTMVLPYALTPVAAVLGLAGTAAPGMPAQLRVSLLIYAAFFCAVGQEFNFYWGWVTASLWTYALLYCKEGLSALLTSVTTMVALPLEREYAK